jgi:hypothetical protein
MADLFPGSIHAFEVALLESPDIEIWEFAKSRA